LTGKAKERIVVAHNVGRIDRIVRISLGTVTIVLGIVFRNWLGLIGLIPLVTGIFGFCPLYRIFHVSTESKADKYRPL
jgi:cadmium resistance protein CadD (predicted permease)